MRDIPAGRLVSTGAVQEGALTLTGVHTATTGVQVGHDAVVYVARPRTCMSHTHAQATESPTDGFSR